MQIKNGIMLEGMNSATCCHNIFFFQSLLYHRYLLMVDSHQVTRGIPTVLCTTENTQKKKKKNEEQE